MKLTTTYHQYWKCLFSVCHCNESVFSIIVCLFSFNKINYVFSSLFQFCFHFNCSVGDVFHVFLHFFFFFFLVFITLGELCLPKTFFSYFFFRNICFMIPSLFTKTSLFICLFICYFDKFSNFVDRYLRSLLVSIIRYFKVNQKERVTEKEREREL